MSLFIKLVLCKMTKDDRIWINQDSNQNIFYQLDSHQDSCCKVPSMLTLTLGSRSIASSGSSAFPFV